jgi:glycosyltransferase involved in cell wall biosynthesis
VKILFIQNRPLFPADTGGKIRTLNVLKHLARWHDVTYLCSSEAGDEPHLAQMSDLGLKVEAVPHRRIRRGSLRFWTRLATNLFSSLPLSIAKNYDPALRRRACDLVAQGNFDLLICDFLHTARYGAGLGLPSVLFQHNVEAQILARHAEQDGGRLRRLYMGLQYRRTLKFESRSGRDFDAVIAVSQTDRETFRRDYRWQHAHAIDTAVDLDYFQPAATPVRPERCAFVGSLDWMPNADGVIHFVRNVWPLVRQRRPAATFAIVGRSPSPAVLKLAEVPGVEVHASVPDVRPYLADAAAVLVPLHVGGGTRLKIFAAMAMAKAIVSTTLGAEGLPVEHGRDILIADGDQNFADAVIALLESPQKQSDIGQAARHLVLERFGTEGVARQFERVCLDVVSSRAPAFDHRPVSRPSRPCQLHLEC